MRTYRIYPDSEALKKVWKENSALNADYPTIKAAKAAIAEFDSNPYSGYRDRKKWDITFHITAYENNYDFVRIVAENL